MSSLRAATFATPDHPTPGPSRPCRKNVSTTILAKPRIAIDRNIPYCGIPYQGTFGPPGPEKGRGGTRLRIPPRWWTRSERIRTASEVSLEFPLTEAEAPLYQRLAPEVARLRRLGLSRRRIGTVLGMDDKTVEKALRWREGR